ncbi:MAG: transposase [Actinobacteria bacterium]|jgi:putative transposase|nr:transposase [Actinomycetota bacterium]MCA1740331.1 transposase [Actinomycetota bacterium]
MNPPKADELDYIHFLIAAQKIFTCTEAARSQPEGPDPPAHDAFTRLLIREPPDTEALWEEAKTLVEPERGLLIVDDTTLDKPYSRKIELVHRHWSGKHQRVVNGINLATLLWSEAGALVPTDFRIYDKPNDGFTKNDHFRAMLKQAKERGFEPRYVLFDSWYSSLDNLKAIRSYGWRWLCRLKSNRLVNPDKSGNVAIREVAIGAEGRIVHLKAYGMVKVFRTVAKDGGAEHWATNDLAMSETDREELEGAGWGIEAYHRALKQCCGIERAQVRRGRAQRNHLGLALRAFLRLEINRLERGVSWYEAKLSIIRDAIRRYLAEPLYLLSPTA